MFFEQSKVHAPLVMRNVPLGSTEHHIQLNHIVLLLSNALPSDYGREKVLVW